MQQKCSSYNSAAATTVLLLQQCYSYNSITNLNWIRLYWLNTVKSVAVFRAKRMSDVRDRITFSILDPAKFGGKGEAEVPV